MNKSSKQIRGTFELESVTYKIQPMKILDTTLLRIELDLISFVWKNMVYLHKRGEI